MLHYRSSEGSLTNRGILHTQLLLLSPFMLSFLLLQVWRRKRDAPVQVATCVLSKFMEKAEETEARQLQVEKQREERQREQDPNHKERMMMLMAGAIQQISHSTTFVPFFSTSWSLYTYPYYSHHPFPLLSPPVSPVTYTATVIARRLHEAHLLFL